MCRSYQILVIDPPWKKGKDGLRKVRPGQNKRFDYPVMETAAIFELLDEAIFPNADTPHCVFMWTIEQYLPICEQFMKERNYKIHCRFIWDKTNGVAPAFTIRYSHEYLIWFYHPQLPLVSKKVRAKFRTVFGEKAREHSRKPDFAYSMIEQLYPEAKRIDVFSREK
jgi:N6-adenosine-specific RNA methylase IME4